MMTNTRANWKFFVIQFPRHAMRLLHGAVKEKLAVSLWITISKPQPTVTGSVYFGPKSVLYFVHAALPAGSMKTC